MQWSIESPSGDASTITAWYARYLLELCAVRNTVLTKLLATTSRGSDVTHKNTWSALNPSLGTPHDEGVVTHIVSPGAPGSPLNFPTVTSDVIRDVSSGLNVPDASSTTFNPAHLPPNKKQDDGSTSLELDDYDVLGDVDDDDTNDYDSEDSGGAAAMGRISDANAAIIKAGYLEVQNAAKDVATRTGLSVSQVFKQWSLGHRRKHVGLNHWNLYSKYFKDNEKQELARLSYREFYCYFGLVNTPILKSLYQLSLVSLHGSRIFGIHSVS